MPQTLDNEGVTAQEPSQDKLNKGVFFLGEELTFNKLTHAGLPVSHDKRGLKIEMITAKK